MTHTSLGVMWTTVPHWFAADTQAVVRGRGGLGVEYGHPWIDSPIFDRLAGERFGNATA